MVSARKKFLVFVILLFMISLIIPFSGVFADTNPEVCAKHADYKPGQKVMISGEGFISNETYLIVITRPDGSIVKGDGSEEPGSDEITTDKKGSFKYKYLLEKVSDSFDPAGTYIIEVFDNAGGLIAYNSFKDSTVRW